MATADETLAAACDSKIACLSNRDLLVVIAEALHQGAGGGGGDGTIFETVVELNNAQILTLPTIPVEIVAPTEILNYSGIATTLPILSAGYVRWKTFAGAYGNISNPSDLLFAWGSDFSADASIAISWTSGITNGNLLPIGLYTPYVATTTNLLDGLQDNGIFLASRNTGNFTGGNAANVIQVALFYRIWNLTTGAFS